MEPPWKRPRLSLFHASSPGTELDTARLDNDMMLKSRFESIFSRYSQDFTGIGDEIDMVTGEVVVNNGHLESMEAETDLGIDHLASDFTSTGRSMLRAMTVNLNPDLPGPDDVLMSIEAIAENAGFDGDLSSGDTDDNLLETSRASSVDAHLTVGNSLLEELFDVSVEPYNSDTDSLFEEDFAPNTDRFGSEDSLFESNSNVQLRSISTGDRSSSFIALAPIQDMNENEDIIAKFGPQVGKQVLNLIGQRQEAHIEPAWRIPVNIARPKARRSTPQMTYSPSSDGSPESPESRQNKSLWALPKGGKQRNTEDSASSDPERGESIDPLQEDFFTDVVQPTQFQEGNTTTLDETNTNHDDKFVQETLVQAAATGECPYCHSSFGNKSGVMAHWDRFLRHAQKRIKKPDPHDYDMMRRIRSKAVIRIRYPRLVVYDFRTMVELHEGAGLSFNEVAASKTLRTRKTGLQLQAVYNKHRTSPYGEEPSKQGRAWTTDEESILQEMCKNPLATMTTLRRALKGRDELAIGNHLADMWLAQLGIKSHTSTIIQASENVSNIGTTLPTSKNLANLTTTENVSHTSLQVKQESDDELFD